MRTRLLDVVVTGFMLAMVGSAGATNALFIPTVVLDPATGETAQAFVSASWDAQLQGFAFGIRVPPSFATVEGPLAGATDQEKKLFWTGGTVLAGLHAGNGPDFLHVNLAPANGPGMTVAVVLTTNVDDQQYLTPPSGSVPVLRVGFTPSADLPAGSPGVLEFTDSLGSPPVEIGFSLLPANWQRPQLSNGFIESLRPILLSDKNENTQFDAGEDSGLFQSQSTLTLLLKLRAPLGAPRTFAPTVRGLPEGSVVTFEDAPPWSVASDSRVDKKMTVALPKLNELGSYDVYVEFSGFPAALTSTHFVLAATPFPLVTWSWPPFVDGPASPFVFGDLCAHFRWETGGPSQTSLGYREGGAGDFTYVPVSFGTTHAITRCNLKPNTLYQWEIKLTVPGLPGESHCPAPGDAKQGWFEIRPGVRFSQQSYSITIDRDYERLVAIGISNDHPTNAAQVRATLLEPLPEKLIVGFVGPGSEDETLELPPASAGQLQLGIHAQDAPSGTYSMVAELTAEGVAGARALADITVTVRKPFVDFSISRVRDEHENPIQQLGTLANAVRIRNLGDPITDLAVSLEGPKIENVTIEPSVSHGYLKTGGTVDLMVIPKLGPAITPETDYEGEVVARGLGEERRCAFAFEVPDDEILHDVTVENPAFCARGSNWYCTNRPDIQIPLAFPAGLGLTGIHQATLTLTLSPSPSWHVYNHTVTLYLNAVDEGHRLGSIAAVPRPEVRTINFNPALLRLDPDHAVTNVVYIISRHNRGHYVMAADVQICVCVESIQGFVYAPPGDPEEAKRRLLNREGLSLPFGNLAITILEPAPETELYQGIPFCIQAQVTNAGLPVARGVTVNAVIGEADRTIRLQSAPNPDAPSCNGNAAQGIYAGMGTADRVESPTVTIKVWTEVCGGVIAVEQEYPIDGNPCLSFLPLLNQNPFYDNCEMPMPPTPAPPKRAPGELHTGPCATGADLWVLGGFYPPSVKSVGDSELAWEVDANAWFHGASPQGGLEPALSFALKGVLPPEFEDAIRLWLTGTMGFDGLIAHASSLRCVDSEGPSIEALLVVSADFGGRATSASDAMLCRYDSKNKQIAYQCPLEIETGSPGQLAEATIQIEKKITAGLILTGAAKATGTLDLQARLASDGTTAPFALVGGPLIDFKLDGTFSVEAPPGFPAQFSATATILPDSGGTFLSQFALAMRDVNDQEAEYLRSPYEDEYGPTIAIPYAGLRALAPSAFVRLLAKVKFDVAVKNGETTVHQFQETVSFDKKRTFQGIPAILTDDAVFEPTARRKDDTAEQEQSINPDGKTLLGIKGTNTGTYTIAFAVPAVFANVPDPETKRALRKDAELAPYIVDTVVIELQSKETVLDQVDWIVFDAAKLTTDIQTRIDAGTTLTDAKREVINALDLDRDGEPDVLDPSLHSDCQPAVLEVVGDLPGTAVFGTPIILRFRLTDGNVPLPGVNVTLEVDGSAPDTKPTGAAGEVEYTFTPAQYGNLAIRAASEPTGDRCADTVMGTTYVTSYLRIASPAPFSIVGGTVPICVEPVEDSTRTSLELFTDGQLADAAGFPGTCYPWDTSVFEDGSNHTVCAVATYSDGREVRECVIVAKPCNPPALDPLPERTVICLGDPCEIAANAGRPDRDTYTYEWTSSNGVTFDPPDAATTSVAFPAAGTHTIECAVRLSETCKSPKQSTTVVVVDTIPLTIEANTTEFCSRANSFTVIANPGLSYREALEYTWTVKAPDDNSDGPIGGPELLYTPKMSGIFEVTCTAKLGSCAEASQTVGVEVDRQFKRGDVNGDGAINIADPIFLLSHLFAGKEEPVCADAADANDDETLNIADPIKILGHLFNHEGDLPEPFANCGYDTTSGNKLSCCESPCSPK